MWGTESGRERKIPSYRKTPWYDRNMGTRKLRQRGATGPGTDVPGLREELLVVAHQGREAQISGGGRQKRASSR